MADVQSDLRLGRYSLSVWLGCTLLESIGKAKIFKKKKKR